MIYTIIRDIIKEENIKSKSQEYMEGMKKFNPNLDDYTLNALKVGFESGIRFCLDNPEEVFRRDKFLINTTNLQ